MKPLTLYTVMQIERKQTHYEALSVASTADQAEIRRAYLAAARKWHPDRHLDLSATEGAKAESAMRRVNEAWKVLGTAESRKVYDRQLAGSAGGANREGVRVDDGITRIDPRYLDPEVLTGRRQQQQDRSADRSALILRLVPLFAILSLLIGILIFTAYARDDDGVPVAADSTVGTTNELVDEATDQSSSEAEPQSMGAGIEAGDCVSLLAGGSLLERPCGPGTIGKVIGPRPLDESCPIATVREVLLSTGVVVCLGAV